MVKRRLSELAGRLALLAGSACLALLAAEAAVRLLRPQAVWWYTPGLFVIDAGGGLALQPGYRGRSGNRVEFDTGVHVNSRGLRGPEIGVKRAGRARILNLGDSFTFGVGVEDVAAYPALLSRELARRGRPVESLNGGLPAVGPVEEVRWLESHGLGLRPDLVLLGLFVGNDLLDAALGLEGWEVADGRLGPAGATRGLRSWLYFNSHLVALLKTSVPIPAQRRLRAWLGLGEPPSVELARTGLRFHARRPDELVRRGEARTAAALDRLVALAEEQRFGAAAILIPDVAVLDGRLWARGLEQLGADAAGYDPDAPRRVLERLLAARDVPTLDLTGPFRRRLEAGEDLYYRIDRHWTPEGHRLAARRIAEFLLREGALEAAAGPLSRAPDGPAL